MDGETFDYGLDPGESFIPEELGEIDAGAPHIMTVLGPVQPGALGATNSAAIIAGIAETKLAAGATLTELEEAGFVGIAAFVAIDPIATAEELAPLRWLAERSNQHFIYGFTPPRADFDREVRSIVEAVSAGLGEAEARPGFVSVAFDQLSMAIVAREATGLPIMVALGAADVESLISSAPDDLEGIVARITGDVERASLEALAEAGAFLLFDGIVGDRNADPALARVVAELGNGGWLQSLLLGYHPRTAPESVSYGVGSRWSYLIEQFPLLVLDAGLDAMAMRTILIDNPNEAFVIHPPS